VVASGYPGSPGNLNPADLLDAQTPTLTTGIPVSFDVSAAVLQGWAADSSTNHGVIVVESPNYTTEEGFGAGHSDTGYITSGQGSPVLTFPSD
jgi:hypothetical protein